MTTVRRWTRTASTTRGVPPVRAHRHGVVRRRRGLGGGAVHRQVGVDHDVRADRSDQGAGARRTAWNSSPRAATRRSPAATPSRSSFPSGPSYRVNVPEGLDRFAGICGFADSGPRTVVDNDADGDGVSDDLDACVDVEGDGTSTDGCPLVERTFTNLTYAGGAVTGTLKVRNSEAGGCTAANTVWVTPPATGITLTGQAAQGTGTFAVPVNLADGDDYVLYRRQVPRSRRGMVPGTPQAGHRRVRRRRRRRRRRRGRLRSRGGRRDGVPLGVPWSSGSSPTSPTPTARSRER